jgi:hypothetical protein
LHGSLPQEDVLGAGHVPVPSQNACAVTLPPEQVGARHCVVPAGTGAWQTPAWHVSTVQTFPSSAHVVPSVTGRCWHVPPAPHESAVHSFPSSQFFVAPAHCPAAHTSPVVHGLPSSHAAVVFVNMHPEAGSQESAVQPFPSSHTVAEPPTQDPLWQRSLVVQGFPSSQDAPLAGACSHPLLTLQESAVHGLRSSQLTLAPTQAPPVHASPVVQALPSSHAAVLFV